MKQISEIRALALVAIFSWLLFFAADMLGWRSQLAKTTANFVNHVTAPLYQSSARDNYVVLELDRASFTENGVITGERGRKLPDYRYYADILTDLQAHTALPAILFDLYFLDIRQDEGFDDFLAAVCRLAPASCTLDTQGILSCAPQKTPPETLFLFSDFVKGEGTAALLRLSVDCPHVVPTSTVHSEKTQDHRYYPLRGKRSGLGAPQDLNGWNAAVDMFVRLCDAEKLDPSQNCKQTILKIGDLDKSNRRFEVVWGRGSVANHQADAATAQCQGNTSRQIFSSEDNIWTRSGLVQTNPCPYAETIKWSQFAEEKASLADYNSRVFFIGAPAEEVDRDPFPISGGPDVLSSGVHLHAMAFDNLMHLGRNIKTDKLTIFGRAIGIDVPAILIAVMIAYALIGLNVRLAGELADLRFRAASLFVQRLCLAFVDLAIFAMLAAAIFFILDLGFQSWVTSLGYGTLLSFGVSLRLASLHR